MTVDEISLTLPREKPFYDVAHLVVGGLAVRLNITFENLEDLQVALAGLLEEAKREGDVTVVVGVSGDVLEARVGPVDRALRSQLEREPGDDVGLRRILDTVVDSVELEDRGGEQWVALTKKIRLAPAEDE